MKSLKQNILLIIGILLVSIFVSCNKEDTDPLPLSPNEWWESLSPDWKDCILYSSETIDHTVHFDPEQIQEKTYFVNLNGYNFKNLDPLKYMYNITGLTCTDSSLTNIEGLFYLNNLEVVNLSGTRISDISSLKNSIRIKELSFNFTNVNDIGIISNLTKLEQLQFIETKVETLNPLKDLKMVRRLIFYSAPINSLKPIMNFDSLEYLDCSWTRIPEIEINEFKLKHPDCIVSN